MMLQSEEFYISFIVSRVWADAKTGPSNCYLCFRHAAKRAAQGADVQLTLTPYDHICEDCNSERVRKTRRAKKNNRKKEAQSFKSSSTTKDYAGA